MDSPYSIVIDTVIQLLFVVVGAFALRWYLAASDQARAKMIAKTLERLDAVTKPLNCGKIDDGLVLQMAPTSFTAEQKRKLTAMVQMAERIAQHMMTQQQKKHDLAAPITSRNGTAKQTKKITEPTVLNTRGSNPTSVPRAQQPRRFIEWIVDI